MLTWFLKLWVTDSVIRVYNPALIGKLVKSVSIGTVNFVLGDQFAMERYPDINISIDSGETEKHNSESETFDT